MHDNISCHTLVWYITFIIKVEDKVNLCLLSLYPSTGQGPRVSSLIVIKYVLLFLQPSHSGRKTSLAAAKVWGRDISVSIYRLNSLSACIKRPTSLKNIAAWWHCSCQARCFFTGQNQQLQMSASFFGMILSEPFCDENTCLYLPEGRLKPVDQSWYPWSPWVPQSTESGQNQ